MSSPSQSPRGNWAKEGTPQGGTMQNFWAGVQVCMMALEHGCWYKGNKQMQKNEPNSVEANEGVVLSEGTIICFEMYPLFLSQNTFLDIHQLKQIIPRHPVELSMGWLH